MWARGLKPEAWSRWIAYTKSPLKPQCGKLETLNRNGLDRIHSNEEIIYKMGRSCAFQWWKATYLYILYHSGTESVMLPSLGQQFCCPKITGVEWPCHSTVNHRSGNVEWSSHRLRWSGGLAQYPPGTMTDSHSPMWEASSTGRTRPHSVMTRRWPYNVKKTSQQLPQRTHYGDIRVDLRRL